MYRCNKKFEPFLRGELNSLVYPRSTKGGGKALVLLQVGQRVVVKLHGFAGKPDAKLVDSLLHPATGVCVNAARAEFSCCPSD